MEIEKPRQVERERSDTVSLVSTASDLSIDTRSKAFIDACNLAQQGQYEKAKTMFLEVDADCQEYGRAQYLLGCTYNKLDDHDAYKQAVTAFDQSIHSFKTNAETVPIDLFYQKGFAHWKLGAYNDALKSFSTFIRKKGEDNVHVGYLSRALVYNSMGHHNEALSDLNEANRQEKNQTTYSLCCRGRTFAHLALYEKAKEDFQAATRIQPHDFQSHLQLGIVYSELGKYPQALEQFDRTLKSHLDSNSNRAEIYFRQALVLHSTKEYDAATDKLLATIKLDPTHVRAYLRLGRAYLTKDKYSEALAALNTAHRLAPNDKEIIYELSTLHERAERLNTALHERRRALGVQQLEPPRLDTPDSQKAITRTPPPLSPTPSSPRQFSSRKPMNQLLLAAIKQEESLPIAENRLVAYYKTLEEYQLAIDNGDCPEARAFMALCQESEKDFVHPCDSIENFYFELQNDQNARQLWCDFVKELKQLSDSSQLSPLLIHRQLVLERIEANRDDIEKDHQAFENDNSENRKIFYDILRRRISQSLVAFSITGCSTSVVAHNLKGSYSTAAWIIKYLGIASSFVPTFGSVLSSALERERLSLISGICDHTEFSSIARQVAREVSDRYKDQLFRLATNHNELSTAPKIVTIIREQLYESKDTDTPANRVANFASKYVIETVRDQHLGNFGFGKDSKPKICDLTWALIHIVCSAKANLTRRCFLCANVDVNRQLAIQRSKSTPETQNNHWILYDFFRAPVITLDDGSIYAEAKWMNPSLYGCRHGTQQDIVVIKNEMTNILSKKR